jgi:dethiobiotin synthetase
MRALFVAGAHTDVGKTHAACALLRTARARGRTVEALKPVVSGFDPDDWAASDPGRLLAAAAVALTPEALEAISPWRFAAPLSPPMAARREGAELDLGEIAHFCLDRLAGSRADLVLVEGVGGVMSPISEDGTGLDLMQALDLPAVLVGGSYLGAISHVLTAAETLRAHALEIGAIVISESGGPDHPDFAETLAAVAQFAPGTPVVGAHRDGDDAWAEQVLDLLR